MSQTSWSGKCSSFGGAIDSGVGPKEGLGLIELSDLSEWWFSRLFNQDSIENGNGLARSLNTNAFYCAMRFAYTSLGGIQGEILPGYSREQIRRGLFTVCKVAGGPTIWVQAADWGPNLDTGRFIDCSPGVLNAIGAQTDDVLNIAFIEA